MKFTSLISVFQVSNIDKSIEWYKQWLGEPDVIPFEGVAEYQSAPNSWLQLSYNHESEILVSGIVLGVEDIDLTKKILVEKGI